MVGIAGAQHMGIRSGLHGHPSSAHPFRSSPVTPQLPRRHTKKSKRLQKIQAMAGDGIGQPTGTVISFGEALFDCLANEKGVPKEEVKSWTPYPGGAPANVAAAIAKLNVKVAFISALGKDDLAEQMMDLLSERGVDVSGVQQVDLPTRDVLVVYDSSGDRQFVGFGGPNESFADTAISADKLPLEALQSASALVTGTLGLSFPVTAAAMHKAVEAAKSGSAVVVVDVNWRPVFWDDENQAPGIILPYVSKADIVKLSDEEAEWLFGLSASDALQHPDKVLEQLPGVKGVLVTGGGAGCSYAFHGAGGKIDYTGIVPVLKVESTDTTGAGDAFLGGFIASLVKLGGLGALQADADKLRRAVEFAAACGAFTTTKPGAIGAQPSEQDAENLLKSASFASAPAA
ncbi:Ribokinase-like protein [Coccomyxa subellipsoidea C-169]|uniref:Ribokinase-like protein n=1 Tax=Coccomyxa subellipsoidea (strain C-169) TaxID=574566 RepID=I0YR92_COCSC|nr:Ribokinase-like protein [Coccomyxa subellipsoidea C-169]EIE20911.1 Ribokinase-like protein [Coccomyxa subellipsoidea C-169]|eukprot:XP_005645455.1 Ribokinase-like protein [Coccomyxa subellipsoidea C-169]